MRPIALVPRFVPWLLLVAFTIANATVGAETLVYIGTYTRGDSPSKGIYVSTLDASGTLSPPRLAATANNPSFVAPHPDGRTLYAVSENSESGDDAVGVMAYAIEDGGTLRLLGERSSGGSGACHLSVGPDGRCLGVANYGGGSCASFPINEDGSLGARASFHQHVGHSVNPRRQKEPHAHSINFSKNGRQAFVADLGTDKIVMYDVDPATAIMTPSEQTAVVMPAGGGPRHFCFTPAGTVAVSNLEMTSQVALLEYDVRAGTVRLGPQVTSLPGGKPVPGNSTAECLVHPGGRFAYVSNRGHNSIAIFEIENESALVPVGHQSTLGEIPRGFGIDPEGKYLVAANQKSGNVVVFKIDPETGTLSPTGSQIKVGMPVNVRFVRR